MEKISWMNRVTNGGDVLAKMNEMSVFTAVCDREHHWLGNVLNYLQYSIVGKQKKEKFQKQQTSK